MRDLKKSDFTERKKFGFMDKRSLRSGLKYCDLTARKKVGITDNW